MGHNPFGSAIGANFQVGPEPFRSPLVKMSQLEGSTAAVEPLTRMAATLENPMHMPTRFLILPSLMAAIYAQTSTPSVPVQVQA